ncbi:hypothetical protein [Roseovarius rhodophyticola]|uniref:Uncharacterized protein n=1 Tax=Roseovarius rhodophyticola TaxID=3080827 RepID=A0ABZ2TD86_9RHOB|nr:hypothetical protein [Roseovarius sp. W115]MDV2931362.1 hypothetical protein [Roseovarius sp. W115]
MRNPTWEPISVETLALPDSKASIVATSVDAKGNALLLTANRDDQANASAKETRGIGIFPKSRSASDLDFSLVVQSGAGAETIKLPAMNITFPYVDQFSDGGSLLVGARSSWRSKEDFDLNGALIERGAKTAKRVCFGDGIEDVGIDCTDRIWISYFDEGVFGNFGWSHPGPTGLGAGGVNCFDRTGELLWQHNREEASEHIDDCYAMNVSPLGVWFYFYTAFKVARVTDDFSVEYIETPIGGSHSFVTDGHRFVFSSQYREPDTTFHATNLYKGKLVHRRKLSLSLPAGINADEIKMRARGNKLHVFTDKNWIVYDLGSLDYE